MDGQTEDRWALVVQAPDRRAVSEALRIATSRTNQLPGLRSVICADGRAMVTDTYVAVMVPALAGLPDGAWDADAFAVAAKGAGADMLRVSRIGDSLEVVRFAPTSRALAPRVIREMVADGVPDAWTVGTFRIGTVDGAPSSIAGIMADAFEAVEADDYTPEESAFSPTLLSRVLDARPSAFAGGSPSPVVIRPRGLRAGVVMDGETPYAAVMPMRR
jgi:hypothetical protein